MVVGVPIEFYPAYFMFCKPKHEKPGSTPMNHNVTIIHDYVCRFFLISDEILRGNDAVIHIPASLASPQHSTKPPHIEAAEELIKHSKYRGFWNSSLGSGKSRNRQSWFVTLRDRLGTRHSHNPVIHDIKMSDSISIESLNSTNHIDCWSQWSGLII